MQDLRGVMADAECPRCNARQPPPETRLATCRACGLVFTPHELQHRVRPREVDTALPEPKPLPAPPPHVTARRERTAIVIAWPVARYVAMFMFSLGLFLAWIAVNRLVPWSTLFWTGVALSGVFGLLQLFAQHVITIDGDAVSHHIAFTVGLPRRIALDRVTGIEVRKGAWAMWELHLIQAGRRGASRLARTIDPNPLGYAAAIIAEYLET